MGILFPNRTRAQESRAAIERLYIVMRHLFNRGHYKPSGVSGQEIVEALHTLSPEIYGSMADDHKVELDGLVYVIDRLPRGIEECRYVRLISEEGYDSSSFENIIPAKRRRNCFRIDKNQMLVEVTRGRSEIYDILTHLTFLYVEANKIYRHSMNEKGEKMRDWKKLEEIVKGEVKIDEQNRDMAFSYLSNVLGRTFEETKNAYLRFCENKSRNNGLFHVIYWLGKIAQEEAENNKQREISFTPTLREQVGHHIYGEIWATNIKKHLLEYHLLDRPIHIISANMHSVMNSLYAYQVLTEADKDRSISQMALELSKEENRSLQKKISDYASKHGMIFIEDESGTNLNVQIFDTAKMDVKALASELKIDKEYLKKERPVIIVMDYAFGEQAYETMDELLKPFEIDGKEIPLPVVSVSVMGKAGILTGGKGDIMLPTAHVFEGTADNYPFENKQQIADYEEAGVHVCKGPMVTVLGTSLQNKDVLDYFKNSSWKAIGLEMEGAHYQKAIQSAAYVRSSINPEKLELHYAYYASDNPLVTGGTLASGSLGMIGVRPTYLITLNILNKILAPAKKKVVKEVDDQLSKKLSSSPSSSKETSPVASTAE
ncbi:DUF6909 family protein [Chondrinema litorale]|uniref:DUF6909 family protein n=1 Tax=Chondrinema litorale TaxID=2994555 RepID=UPI002543C79A|nr:hypothetical protein [Chondrinema litorale]UZR92706.1 hypothetical protein OQ292_12645 [Chondrinema litorale]